MKQLAAIMMFAAWLLYGAMPALAMPFMPHEMTGQTVPSGTPMASHDHSQYAGTADIAAGNTTTAHAGDAQGGHRQSCPNGNQICAAAFCSACLVVLPDLAFADTGRFIHRYGAPQTGAPLIFSGLAPLTPPPRS